MVSYPVIFLQAKFKPHSNISSRLLIGDLQIVYVYRVFSPQVKYQELCYRDESAQVFYHPSHINLHLCEQKPRNEGQFQRICLVLLSGLLMLRTRGLHLITKMGMNQCISTITDMRASPSNNINLINYKHIITYFNQQNNPSSFEHTTSLYVIKFCCLFIMLAQLLKNTLHTFSVYHT